MTDHEHNEHEHEHDEGQVHGEESHVDEPERVMGMPVSPEDDDETRMELGNQALADALRISFMCLKGLMVILVIGYLAQGVCWANQGEVKFIVGFGRVRGDMMTSESAVRLRWPWEEEITVSEQERQIKIDQEFWPENTRATDEGLRVVEDGYLVTGDQNIVHMKFTVPYVVASRQLEFCKDRETAARNYAFLLGEDNASRLLQQLAMSAATKVVSGMSVDPVLAATDLAGPLKTAIQEEVDQFEARSGIDLGIEIRPVSLSPDEGGEKNPREPYAVSQAFKLAQDAVSKQRTSVENGRQQASKTLAEAQTRAAATKGRAEAAANRLVGAASADAQLLQSMLSNIYGDGYEAPYYEAADGKRYAAPCEVEARTGRRVLRLLGTAEDEPEVFAAFDPEKYKLVIPALPERTAVEASKERVLKQRLYMRSLEQVFEDSAAAFVLHEMFDGSVRDLWLNMKRPRMGSDTGAGPGGPMPPAGR